MKWVVMYRRRSHRWFIVFMFVAALSSAHADNSNTASVHSVVSSLNTLGFDILHCLGQSQPDQNVFISPTSIGLALCMAYNGAGGVTKGAMAHTLHLGAISDEALNGGNSALMASLTRTDSCGGVLQVANSLWATQGQAFIPKFKDSMSVDYDAAIKTIDFHAPDAAALINRWVNDKTNGKIPTIIDRIEPNEVLFLLNAVHFKANWAKPFPASSTYDHPFNAPGGSQFNVKMMRNSDTWSYIETQGYQAVRLGYSGQQRSMLIVLPRPGFDLSKFAAGFDQETCKQMIDGMSTRPGDIELPHVRLDYESMLNSPLTKLGMGIAFSNKAGFSAMLTRPTAISKVIHKTYLSIDEQGTEAAAATAVGMRAFAMRAAPKTPFTMVVDHPFFCAIIDRATGALLFMGVIYNPGHA